MVRPAEAAVMAVVAEEEAEAVAEVVDLAGDTVGEEAEAAAAETAHASNAGSPATWRGTATKAVVVTVEVATAVEVATGVEAATAAAEVGMAEEEEAGAVTAAVSLGISPEIVPAAVVETEYCHAVKGKSIISSHRTIPFSSRIINIIRLCF